jgi:hypothetical protein
MDVPGNITPRCPYSAQPHEDGLAWTSHHMTYSMIWQQGWPDLSRMSADHERVICEYNQVDYRDLASSHMSMAYDRDVVIFCLGILPLALRKTHYGITPMCGVMANSDRAPRSSTSIEYVDCETCIALLWKIRSGFYTELEGKGRVVPNANAAKLVTRGKRSLDI